MVTIEFYDEDTNEIAEFGQFSSIKIRHSIIHAVDGNKTVEIGHQRHDGFWQFNEAARHYCATPRTAKIEPSSLFSNIIIGTY